MKRNIIWNFVLLSALIMVVASSCKKDDTGDGLDFEITIPTDWNYQIYGDPTILYWAWSPQRTADDAAGIRDAINEDMLVTKQSYANSSLDGFYSALVVALMEFPSFIEISATDTTINSEPAIKMIHLQTIKIPIVSTTITSDSADLDIQPIKYLFYRNGYGYVVDCGTTPYTHSHYKPIFDDIMSTFKFKN